MSKLWFYHGAKFDPGLYAVHNDGEQCSLHAGPPLPGPEIESFESILNIVAVVYHRLRAFHYGLCAGRRVLVSVTIVHTVVKQDQNAVEGHALDTSFERLWRSWL